MSMFVRGSRKERQVICDILMADRKNKCVEQVLDISGSLHRPIIGLLFEKTSSRRGCSSSKSDAWMSNCIDRRQWRCGLGKSINTGQNGGQNNRI